MKNNKPIIEINDESITIDYGENNRKNYKFKISPQTYNALKREPISLKKVALSVLTKNLENPDLLDDEIVLEIIDRILKIGIKNAQYAEKLRNKRDEEKAKIIKAPKEQGKLEAKENQSKNETNEGKYKTNEDYLNQWLNEGKYSKCANMLKSLGPERRDNFLDNLLRQRNGYEKCIEILFSLRKYDSNERGKLISELDTIIPKDTRTKISLEELRAKISSAEDKLIKSLEMSEKDAHSEEIVEDDESDKDDLEELIATLNLEELVTPNPDPDAISKLVEIEMHIEYDKEKNIDEEQQEENEHDEAVNIEDNEDKDDSREQLLSNVNQLMEELEQLNIQILEIDEEIKKCDDIIRYYAIFSALKTIKAQINEIEDKTMLRNLNDDEEKELEQLKENRNKLIQKLRLLRSNSSIPEFQTEYDLKKMHTAKVLGKEDLEPKSEELKTIRDEIKRKIGEITETTDEKDR